jgi:hypothetical protein
MTGMVGLAVVRVGLGLAMALGGTTSSTAR